MILNFVTYLLIMVVFELCKLYMCAHKGDEVLYQCACVWSLCYSL